MVDKLLHGLLWAAVTLAAVIVYDRMNFDGRLPIESWVGVEVINSPIKAGEEVDLLIRRKKVRDDCTVASSRQAVDEDGRPYRLADEVWRGGDPGSEELRLSYPVPETIPVGTYLLRVYLTYTCPDFVWTTQQPDARFRVVE